MTDDPDYSVSNAKATANVQNACAGGVPGRKWFVALVRNKYERKCRDMLLELGYEAFVASQQEIHVYHCRKRHKVERIVIPAIVFLHATEKERLQAMKQCPLIYHFLTNKALVANDLGRHPYAVVPDYQMEQLRFMLYHAESQVNFTDHPLHVGERIRIVRGQLKGFEGNVMHSDNTTYVVACLDFLGCAMVTVSPNDIERAQTE